MSVVQSHIVNRWLNQERNQHCLIFSIITHVCVMFHLRVFRVDVWHIAGVQYMRAVVAIEVL